jgi:NhaP-type Na+/H+ or K+/H+ antiporter
VVALSPGSKQSLSLHNVFTKYCSGYFNRQTEDAVFSNVVDLLFNSAAFIYVGALLPFPDFNNHAIGVSMQVFIFATFALKGTLTNSWTGGDCLYWLSVSL